MIKLINRKNILFFLVWAMTLLIAITSLLFLPEKFFYDSNEILRTSYSVGNWLKGSYPFTSNFYYIIGLSYLPFSVIGFFQIALLFVLTIFIVVPKKFTLLHLEDIIVAFSILLLGVFFRSTIKEFIAFLIMYLILIIIRKYEYNFLYRCGLSSVILIVVAVLFRPYYVLLPFLVLGMYFTLLIVRKQRVPWVILSGISMLIVVSLIVYSLKGEYLTELYREQVNDPRRGEEYANSIISSPLRPNTFFKEIFSILYGIVSVNLPIEGFRHITKPQIIIFVLWQLFFISLFLKALIKYIENFMQNKERVLILLFLLSFFIVQGVFEPDLGSAIRHKIGIFPFIYYIFIYEKYPIGKFKK